MMQEAKLEENLNQLDINNKNLKEEKKESDSKKVYSISEDKDYDYEKEVEEIWLQRQRPNTFFEDNDFKKDDKLGLVYTNDEYLKK